MSLEKAVACGVVGNEVSKQITGSSELSLSRTAIAVSSGAVAGATVSGAVVVGLGVASAPVTVPLAVASGLLAGVASLFD
ncbi:hypothetical protein [Pseudoalteromonas sp. APC 3694]|jgi:hypothetical protein|uniref:hypothetical protein n=1 Tax=Pseudoalteromonas sp. APC 3694 TaxID=3035202 RepID=UPI0025B50939|nr:hypothetical protein [Pseudoalteromonas sp. APC 3694]MDN3488531.1 hypothetical protein [Pseudoalteromonas sp. APC 3694]